MGVKSAERVLRIFELLADHPGGMSNKEISESLGYAPSSTINILKTLSDEGYLNTNEHKKYTLGGKLIQLGSIASSHLNMGELAAPILRGLMEELKETCFMGILSHNEVVYIAKANSNQTVSTNASIGSKKPLYCTGLGKVFLSFMPEEESDILIKKTKFYRYARNTVRNADELREQLLRFRQLGYATDDEEIEDGLWCLAVPIFDEQGDVIAAISTSGPITRMQQKTDLIKRKMLEASEFLSNKLGYYKGGRTE